VEPLTGRELDVLRLLATPLSTAEIAERLFVAVSTVRSHTKSIYGKLNVHQRADAAERARELKLI
jgi:LuxR family maltose regulon positive regulatory protein